MSTGASGSGGLVGSTARGGNQQRRGQRGRPTTQPMTTARLHALIYSSRGGGTQTRACFWYVISPTLVVFFSFGVLNFGDEISLRSGEL